jgi:mannose-6-phosphate isomerase-like protein (cupin superfamily)
MTAATALPVDVEAVRQRLEASGGGCEVVHSSAGLELGVYVLVAPEADRQQPHEDNEVYVVLDGSGALEIEGETVPLERGQALFVPAGADHRFVGYVGLSLLVVFAKGAAL